MGQKGPQFTFCHPKRQQNKPERTFPQGHSQSLNGKVQDRPAAALWWPLQAVKHLHPQPAQPQDPPRVFVPREDGDNVTRSQKAAKPQAFDSSCLGRAAQQPQAAAASCSGAASPSALSAQGDESQRPEK